MGRGGRRSSPPKGRGRRNIYIYKYTKNLIYNDVQGELILHKSLYTKRAHSVGGKRRCLEPAFPPLQPLHPPSVLLQLWTIYVYTFLQKLSVLLHVYTSTKILNDITMYKYKQVSTIYTESFHSRFQYQYHYHSRVCAITKICIRLLNEQTHERTNK